VKDANLYLFTTNLPCLRRHRGSLDVVLDNSVLRDAVMQRLNPFAAVVAWSLICLASWTALGVIVFHIARTPKPHTSIIWIPDAAPSPVIIHGTV
jgi:hypothetical protein